MNACMQIGYLDPFCGFCKVVEIACSHVEYLMTPQFLQQGQRVNTPYTLNTKPRKAKSAASDPHQSLKNPNDAKRH